MKPLSIIFLFLFSMIGFSQEGIPLYTDYLTDNYYLVHPSMAGSSFEGGKARMTLRKQWFGQEEAPNLQTLSAHIRLGNRSGVGAIIFNDQNGYHAQTGLYLTYAHHINFFRSSAELELALAVFKILWTSLLSMFLITTLLLVELNRVPAILILIQVFHTIFLIFMLILL